jgi:hypothetical protein
MTDAPCYAVFAEYSPVIKPARTGMNTRVFNRVEARSADGAIQLDEQTGVVTLPPGTYHMTGFSTVVYYTGDEPPEMVEPRTPASGGYCRLRRLRVGETVEESAEDRDAGFVFGSISTANAVPSLVETYFTTAEAARIVMEHQSGSDPKDIYLQVYSNGSSAHVFARLSIRRL